MILDHDLAHSPNHGRKECCGKDREDKETCAPIDVLNANDYFRKQGVDCISMVRSMTSPNINCEMDTNGQTVSIICLILLFAVAWPKP